MEFELNLQALYAVSFTTILALSISACGGASSNSSTSQPVPEANTSLDTQTPAGIWMLKSELTGNYRADKVNTNTDSTASVRQFVVMRELADGSFLMPECGLEIFREQKNISLHFDGNRVLDSGISAQLGNSEETFELSLDFKDNLTFSGEVTVNLSNEASDTAFYKDTKTAKISGVKVSDSLKFHSADELAVTLTAKLNDQESVGLADLNSEVNCLAVSTATYRGTQIGQDISIDESLVFLSDSESHEMKFELESGRVGSESIADESYFSSLPSLQSSGAASCATNDTSCILTESFKLSQSSALNNISAEVQASNQTGEGLNLAFTIEVK